MVKALFVIFLLLSQASLARVQTSISPNPAYTGDTLTLTITADDINQSTQPDLSELKKDFTILGQSTSQQIQIINGSRTDKHTWSIRLQPLKKGIIYIPQIKVGKELTQQIVIKIQDIPVEVQERVNNIVSIETEILNKDKPHYVQQEVSLVVRLRFTSELLEGTLSEPLFEDTISEKLGKDLRYQATLNGKDVSVIERRYSIFPEKSGELIIPPLNFQGKIKSAQSINRRRSSTSLYEQFWGRTAFQKRDPGRPVSTQSKAITLKISPLPKTIKTPYWLPSSQFLMEDSWAKKPPIMSTGVPVTRTITMMAYGLTAPQLTELKFDQIEDTRIYVDPPVTSSHTDNKNIIAKYEQKITYLPSKPGDLSVPAISVSWWNTKTDTQETTTLPSWNFKVTGEGIVSDTTKPDKKIEVESEAQKNESSAITDSLQFNKPKYIIISIAAIAIVLGLLLLYLNRNKKQKPYINPKKAKPATAKLLKKLIADAKTKNPNEALKSLIKLAQATWPDKELSNLHQLKQQLPQHHKVISELDRALYQQDQNEWNSLTFVDAFKHGLHDLNDPKEKTANSKSKEDLLESLYHTD